MAPQRVVVTGAGGFIGAAVCREFIRSGDDVRALIGPPGVQLTAPPGVSMASYADIDDASALRALIDESVEVVVHLAGPPSVRASFADPVGFARAHTGGTAAVLDACRIAGVSRIVYISSAEVYGRPKTDPVSELHPLEARSPYAAAKVGAEQMLLAYYSAYGISGVILRPFSIYGPGMGEHSLLAAIVRQLDQAGPIELADLRPERDYCFIDDVTRAIRYATQRSFAEPVVLNIGSGQGTSVHDLARAVLRLAGIDRGIEERTLGARPRGADILRLVADPSRARDVLGWQPEISLTAGLLETLAAMPVSR